MWRDASRLALALALAYCCLGLHPVQAAHAAIGTLVPALDMPAFDGARWTPGDADATVLVFFRPDQEHAAARLRELARCRDGLVRKSVQWVGVVSDSAAAQRVSSLAQEAGFTAPILIDRGDQLYGSLGISLHPVVVILGRDRRLVAFEPFRSIDYCTVVTARIRHVLREISDDELRTALAPPKAVEGGESQVARRYRALAQTQLHAGALEKALASVRKSLEHDPKLAPAHALLADILAAQGDCAGARDALAAAVAIDPGLVAPEAVGRCGSAR